MLKWKLAPHWFRDCSTLSRYLSLRGNVLVKGRTQFNRPAEHVLNRITTIVRVTPYRIVFISNGELRTILNYRLYADEPKYQRVSRMYREHNYRNMTEFFSPHGIPFPCDELEHVVPSELALSGFLRTRVMRGYCGLEVLPAGIERPKARPLPLAREFRILRVERVKEQLWLIHVEVTVATGNLETADITVTHPNYIVRVANVA